MRFSIRDLLWATLVVAMGLGWWATNSSGLRPWVRHIDCATCLLSPRNATIASTDGTEVSFAVLDEPLVEP